jgi:hypothetical protein
VYANGFQASECTPNPSTMLFPRTSYVDAQRNPTTSPDAESRAEPVEVGVRFGRNATAATSSRRMASLTDLQSPPSPAHQLGTLAMCPSCVCDVVRQLNTTRIGSRQTAYLRTAPFMRLTFLQTRILRSH